MARPNVQVLQVPGFRRLFAAQAVSVLGDRIVAVALAFAALSVDDSAGAVGLVLAAGMLPLVLCLLAGGVLADRTSPRAVMLVADLVRVASQGSMAVLLVAGQAELWSLAALAAVTGAATGFFSPASVGLLPAVVPPEHVGEANGLRATASSAGEVLGPLVAGVLVAATGPGWAIAVDAATFGVSAGLLAGLRVPARATGAARTTWLADLREGWSAFASRRWVWSYVACAAVGNVVWAAWSSLGPVVADRGLGGAAAWGTVLAGMGVGSLVGGLVAVRAAPARPLLVSGAATLLMAVPLLALAAGLPVALLVVAAFVAGGGLMLANALWESTLQRNIPADTLARVSSYDWFGSFVFNPLGFVLWAPIAAVVGVHAALWVAGAVLVASTSWLLALRDVREVRWLSTAAPG